MTGVCGHGPESLRFRANGKKECTTCKRERLRRARQGKNGTVRPLVFAAKKAVEQAERLGLPRPVENAVMEVLNTRGVRDPGEGGGAVEVELDERLVAVVGRTRSVSGRKAWLVRAVEAR